MGVGGLPDLAHPALAQQGRDVVVAEAGAGVRAIYSTTVLVVGLVQSVVITLDQDDRLP